MPSQPNHSQPPTSNFTSLSFDSSYFPSSAPPTSISTSIPLPPKPTTTTSADYGSNDSAIIDTPTTIPSSLPHPASTRLTSRNLFPDTINEGEVLESPSTLNTPLLPFPSGFGLSGPALLPSPTTSSAPLPKPKPQRRKSSHSKSHSRSNSISQALKSPLVPVEKSLLNSPPPPEVSSENAKEVLGELRRRFEIEEEEEEEEEEESGKSLKNVGGTNPMEANVRRNLKRLENYPENLPLRDTWILYFSDTSSTIKSKVSSNYSSQIAPIFTAPDVPTLCCCLKTISSVMGFKGGRREGREEDWSLGMSRFKQGMNYHFFRDGVEPVWEDEWNKDGGRFTLMPSLALLDPLFLRIVLLLAGSTIDHIAESLLSDPNYFPPPPQTPKTPKTPKPSGNGGTILGVVANKRNRGDRIEIWVGGERKGEGPALEWTERVKEAFVKCGVDGMRGVRYKRHF